MTIRTNSAALALSPTAPYDNFYASIYGPFEFFGICALFLLFKQGEGLFSKQRLASVAKQLSALSLGIYAIHMLPLRWIDVAVPALLKSLLLKPIIVFAVSAGIVWLWRFLARSVRKGIGKAKEG